MNLPEDLTHVRRFGVLCAGLLLAFGAAGCSGDSSDKSDQSSPAGNAQGNGSQSGNSSQSGDSDRPMGNIGDDDTVRIFVSTLKADRGEWRGKVVILHFSEGSVDEPRATINCSTLGHLIADDETAELHYPDGVLDCVEALAPLN